MKSECENAKQIFVLTHNYNFFSLVLGWFNKKHEKDISTGKKLPAYSIYRVENHIDLDTNNHTVINDILDLIKGLDENHYK